MTGADADDEKRRLELEQRFAHATAHAGDRPSDLANVESTVGQELRLVEQYERVGLPTPQQARKALEDFVGAPLPNGLFVDPYADLRGFDWSKATAWRRDLLDRIRNRQP